MQRLAKFAHLHVCQVPDATSIHSSHSCRPSEPTPAEAAKALPPLPLSPEGWLPSATMKISLQPPPLRALHKTRQKTSVGLAVGRERKGVDSGERSGTVMCIPLHAYLVSQPHRIKVFEQALAHICAHQDDVWFATGAEIAKHFIDNYWDESLADIKARGVATGGTGFAS